MHLGRCRMSLRSLWTWLGDHIINREGVVVPHAGSWMRPHAATIMKVLRLRCASTGDTASDVGSSSRSSSVLMAGVLCCGVAECLVVDARRKVWTVESLVVPLTEICWCAVCSSDNEEYHLPSSRTPIDVHVFMRQALTRHRIESAVNSKDGF